MNKELVPTIGHYDDLMQQIFVLIHLHQMQFNVLIICMSLSTAIPCVHTYMLAWYDQVLCISINFHMFTIHFTEEVGRKIVIVLFIIVFQQFIKQYYYE